MTTRTQQKATPWIDNLVYQIELQLSEMGPRDSVVRVKWMRGVASSLLEELRAHADLVAACKKMVSAWRASDRADTAWNDARAREALEAIDAALAKAGA
jgi:hypothetical protein